MNKRRIILMGAGFSANWGGFLAKEMGAYLHGLMRGPIEDYRLQFLKEDNYEDAWAKILAEAEPGDLRWITGKFEEMLVHAFEFQEQILHDRMHESHAETMVCEWFKDLMQSHKPGQSLIVSTNQDSLLDRQRHGGWQILLPGIQGPSYQVADLGNERKYAVDVPASFSEPDFERNKNATVMLKVHGSFDWMYKKRRVLITGRDKAKDIEGFPYLSQALTWLRDWLQQEPSDLLILGHGMADDQITSLFEEACTDDWRVFVINPSHPGPWIRSCVDRHPRLCQRIEYYLPVRFMTLLNYNTTEYKIYNRRIREPLLNYAE